MFGQAELRPNAPHENIFGREHWVVHLKSDAIPTRRCYTIGMTTGVSCIHRAVLGSERGVKRVELLARLRHDLALRRWSKCK